MTITDTFKSAFVLKATNVSLITMRQLTYTQDIKLKAW